MSVELFGKNRTYLDINYNTFFVEVHQGLTIGYVRGRYFFVVEFPASAFISAQVARNSIDNMLRKQYEKDGCAIYANC